MSLSNAEYEKLNKWLVEKGINPKCPWCSGSLEASGWVGLLTRKSEDGEYELENVIQRVELVCPNCRTCTYLMP
jgi:hypothetical protein